MTSRGRTIEQQADELEVHLAPAVARARALFSAPAPRYAPVPWSPDVYELLHGTPAPAPAALPDA